MRRLELRVVVRAYNGRTRADNLVELVGYVSLRGGLRWDILIQCWMFPIPQRVCSGSKGI